MSKIREPAVSGLFYPEEPNELKQMLNDLTEQNKPSQEYKNILGIIVPHAGYIYSGNSAAVAYNALKENRNFTTAIIVSPSHHVYFRGCSIYDGDFYKTPLGNIPINKGLSEILAANSKHIEFSMQGHGKEHALEVQLPFLQMINNDFDIVPIVIGDQNAEFIQDLSNSLSEIIDESIGIIISSDLSHFHTKDDAQKLDKIVIEHINNNQYPELYNDLAKGNCEACGGGGIVALLQTADIIGDYKAEVLSYTNSGDVTGDYSSVVGYLSAVVYK